MKAPARPTNRRPRVPMLLVLLVAALVGGACGGGGDEGSTSASDGGSTSKKAEGDGGDSEGGDDPRDCDGGGESGQTGDKKWEKAPEYSLDAGTTYTATLTTSAGAMTAELQPEAGPCAANNFVFLAREGFYDGVPFHRIIKDFMVQTGDPTGTGGGGPGYTIKDDEVSGEYAPGTLAMANTGQPNSAGSQFFIMHGTTVELAPTYTIFGKVTKGMDVLEKIANTPVADNGMGEPSKPSKPVTLEKVTIAEAPAE